MSNRTIKRKRGFKTARELLSKIQGDWLDAGIAVSDSLGRPQRITRISLHENEDGGLLVMFHEGEYTKHARQAGPPPIPAQGDEP